MTDVHLPQLSRMVGDLTDDLRTQVLDHGMLRDDLTKEWTGATAAKRTAASFETWLEDILDQAAVAWVLGCVFVRFCEDNRLVDGLWIGGPDAAAPAATAASHTQAYLTENWQKNERDWLRLAFTHLRDLPATHALFDDHNPVWRFDISGRSALDLLEKFRKSTGVGSLATETLDTRFLGDLYQDLSAHAKKTYALLQTPEFVEEFILDRAFEPALAEFGLAAMKVIDPACGSGHFVIGAFHRLVRRWRDAHPDTDIRVLTQRALDQVTGVDINPFAIAIARFRLLVAALKVCGIDSLESAPRFEARLAAGDSLLGWSKEESSHQGDTLALARGDQEFAYFTEDALKLAEYLVPSTYTVVLANPPYITVKDKALNDLYRGMYSACSGKYALTVPFTQRLFRLAKRGDKDGHGAGLVGQITSNSFMKREFGKKLVETFFAGHTELAEVIDTSGAFIPGHGTPTIILIGHNRLVSRRYSGPVRTILGIRGEPSQPEDPAKGRVWRAILEQIYNPGSESDWISVTDVSADRFYSHPWSLSGGGAATVMQTINSALANKLGAVIEGSIGFASFSGVDDLFYLPKDWHHRFGTSADLTRPITTGDDVRDWIAAPRLHAIVPYTEDGKLIAPDLKKNWARHLWIGKQILASLTDFSRRTRSDLGLPWWSWYRWVASRYATPDMITFSHVATHNQFAYCNGPMTYNQHAPVIKLAEGASEDDHLRLLGVLNSSTACFWLKQVSHNKGRPGAEQAGADEPWEHRFEFTGTKLQEFPLPPGYPLERARELERLAQRLGTVTPSAVAGASVPTRGRLEAAQREYESVRAQMIAVQEELDWEVYRLYGLIEDDLAVAEPPEISPAERAFAVVLARRMKAGDLETTWFKHHNHVFTPITELPGHWSDEYRAVVEKRIAVIESDRNIGLIERPECKRRWQSEGWEAMRQKALRDWLLDRLEAPELWAGRPTPMTVAQLADRLRHDEDFRGVLDLWVGNDQYDPTTVLAKLVADEHVPYLPAQRYKKAGLRKRVQWERTWALQRREDAGEDVGTIPVPPKYTSADFTKPSYWRNRGKLDVPKERFVSYPGASPDTDGSLLLGWAGWDHVGQAQALATVYVQRKESRWPAESLLPLLAGLVELEPWLHQWHAEPRDDFPMGSPAEFFTSFVDTELSTLNADRAALDTIRGAE